MTPFAQPQQSHASPCASHSTKGTHKDEVAEEDFGGNFSIFPSFLLTVEESSGLRNNTDAVPDELEPRRTPTDELVQQTAATAKDLAMRDHSVPQSQVEGAGLELRSLKEIDQLDGALDKTGWELQSREEALAIGTLEDEDSEDEDSDLDKDDDANVAPSFRFAPIVLLE